MHKIGLKNIDQTFKRAATEAIKYIEQNMPNEANYIAFVTAYSIVDGTNPIIKVALNGDAHYMDEDEVVCVLSEAYHDGALAGVYKTSASGTCYMWDDTFRITDSTSYVREVSIGIIPVSNFSPDLNDGIEWLERQIKWGFEREFFFLEADFGPWAGRLATDNWRTLSLNYIKEDIVKAKNVIMASSNVIMDMARQCILSNGELDMMLGVYPREDAAFFEPVAAYRLGSGAENPDERRAVLDYIAKSSLTAVRNIEDPAKRTDDEYKKCRAYVWQIGRHTTYWLYFDVVLVCRSVTGDARLVVDSDDDGRNPIIWYAGDDIIEEVMARGCPDKATSIIDGSGEYLTV